MTPIKTRRIHMSRKAAPCPCCGSVCRRHSNARRHLWEIGVTGPTVVEVTYSKHYCERCRKHFSLPMDHLAPTYGRCTWRVRLAAVDLVVHQAMTLDKAAARMLEKHHVRVPPTTLHDWMKAELDAGVRAAVGVTVP